MFKQSFLSLAMTALLLGACAVETEDDPEVQSDPSEETSETSEAVTSCGVLKAGEALLRGQSRTSCDGRFRLDFQAADGNIVLRQGTKVLWASSWFNARDLPPTWQPALDRYLRILVVSFAMQTDGNLVISRRYQTSPNKVNWYDLSKAPRATWSTGTAGHPGARLAIRNDGNLVVYGPQNQVLWHR